MTSPILCSRPALAPGKASYQRYSRQMLPGVLGFEGQKRLLGARVLVIGAGGLGAPVIQYLAAAGVGHLTVVDDDVVEVSNLHRQVIHRDADTGVAKAESAARAVRELNPDIEVEALVARLGTEPSGRDIDVAIAGQDVVVDGTDNFPTRYAVADACARAGVPEVWGSVLGFDAQVSVFWSDAPEGARTLRDLFPNPPAPGAVPSCSEAGVLGALCGQVGSIMAMQVIALVSGVGEPLLGRVLVIDGWDSSTRTLPFEQATRQEAPSARTTGVSSVTSPEFPGDGVPASTITRLGAGSLPGSGEDDALDVEDVATLIDTEPDVLLLDVRERDEHDAGALPGARWIPLGRLLDGSGMSELPHNRRIVAYCAIGARSRIARDLLRDAGWESATHMAGGVAAWERSGRVLVGPDLEEDRETLERR